MRFSALFRERTTGFFVSDRAMSEPGNTVKRLSFVLSFDDTDSSQGFEMVKDALEFLAFTMKKRETGPVGGLLLNYLKDHAEGLYRQRQTSRHPEAPKQPEIIIEILFAEAKVLRDNDPSAGPTTENLVMNFTFSKRYSSVVFPPMRQLELPGKPVEDLTKKHSFGSI